jgi:hypothetical protein
MISFNFYLSNPFSNRWANVFSRSTNIGKHKAVEFEIFRDNAIVSLMFRLSARQSHAGIMLDIGLFGYSVSVQYYDTRHWNEEAGRYYDYDIDGNET